MFFICNFLLKKKLYMYIYVHVYIYYVLKYLAW